MFLCRNSRICAPNLSQAPSRFGPATLVARASCGLLSDPCASLLSKFFSSGYGRGFRINSHHRLSARRSHQHPRAIVENQFHPIETILFSHMTPRKFRERLLQPLDQPRLHVRRQMQVHANRPEFLAHAAKQIVKLIPKRRSAALQSFLLPAGKPESHPSPEDGRVSSSPRSLLHREQSCHRAEADPHT